MQRKTDGNDTSMAEQRGHPACCHLTRIISPEGVLKGVMDPTFSPLGPKRCFEISGGGSCNILNILFVYLEMINFQ